LSTGTNFAALHFDFSIGKSTINGIVKETCKILWSVLLEAEMPQPTKETGLQISDLFYKKTNFPNCLGAIDGKYIRCKNPNHAGSLYFNYKKYFSIVLMAVVDANLNFISIDVGAYGREADPSVFRESVFRQKLYSNLLQIPEPRALPSSENNIQHFVFVAVEAFGLHTNVMRPFPGRGLNDTRRIFNYRLSRARRTVECAFGVLTNKWRVLHTAILVKPEYCDDIVKACCILHNFVRKRNGCNYEKTEENFIVQLNNLQFHGRNVTSGLIETKDNYADYFVTEGAVPFQYTK
jgi:hypothetical protein